MVIETKNDENIERFQDRFEVLREEKNIIGEFGKKNTESNVVIDYGSGNFETKSELFLAADIHVRYLTDPVSFIKALFPYASETGSEICFDGFVVSEALHFNQQYGWMAPGQWAYSYPSIHSPTRTINGFDALGLIGAHCDSDLRNGSGIAFDFVRAKKAFSILTEALNLTYTEISHQSGHLKGWQKIRSPLFVLEDIPPRIAPQLPGWSNTFKLYRNKIGKICSFVFYYIVSKIDLVPIHVSLLRDNKSGRYQWLPIFPEKPFLLYNGDKIFSDQRKEVVFCRDEQSADEYCQGNFIGTTVPGGLENFQDADLDGLRGRKVLMHLTTEDLKHGRLFRKKLQEAGTLEAKFLICPVVGSLSQHRKFAFSDLEQVAERNKVALRVSTVGEKVVIRPIISRPGEAIPDSDVAPRMLLDPIIKEGDLVWLYADSKVGKTWMALAVAHAVAVKGGELGKWRSPEKWEVLYVDGEMKPSTLQDRINKVLVGQEISPKQKLFSVLSAKTQTDGFIDIGSDEWQDAIERELAGRQRPWDKLRDWHKGGFLVHRRDRRERR